jgi:hypothetical protein
MGMVYDSIGLSGVSTTNPGVDEVLQMISEPTLAVFTGVCGLGVQPYSAWRMWARSGHMAWHMTTLDTHTWPRGEVPGLGLIDRDVSVLRGVDCDILALVDGDILAQGSIKLIEYSCKQGASSFSESYLKITFGLSMLGPEQSWDV